MKRLLIWAGGALLILGAVFATVGALASSFHFDMPARQLLPVWLASAFALSAVTLRFRVKGLLLCLIPLLAALIWQLPDIRAGARHVLFYITNEYDKCFDFPVLFRDAAASARELTFFWGAVGIILMLPLSIAVNTRRSAVLTVTVTLPLLIPTLAIIEFSPDPVCLVGLFAVYLTMTFCSALHPDDYRKRGLAIFPAFALALPILGAAYLAAPPDSYNRSELIASLDNRIREITQSLPDISSTGIGWPEGNPGDWRFNTEHVEITGAGPRRLTGRSILEVTSSRAGLFYLRGYSMQEFDGRAWLNNSDELHRQEELSLLGPAVIAGAYGQLYPDAALPYETMTITKTGDRSDVRYSPYFLAYHSNREPAEVDFYYPEDSILTTAAALPPGSLYTDLFGYNEWAREAYTEIDGSTAEALRRLAARAGIDALADKADVAKQVALYVSSSARYTLSPPVIPDGEDFALYFLQTSRQGYCIHFATTAVLMLRALDIPARFTSGFVVAVSASGVGRPVTVTDRRAHAWVEIYYDDIGWIPLEVTPASVLPDASASSPDVGENEDPPPETEPESTSPGQRPEDVPESKAPASPSPSPSRSPGAETDPGESPNPMKGAGGILLCVSGTAVCALLLVLHRYIARRKRVKGFNQADTNAAALCAWRYIVRFSRRTHPPEEIEALALKARFSKHRISEDERGTIVGFAVALSEEALKQAGPLKRLFIKYVRGM